VDIICGICNKNFKNSSGLGRHTKLTHNLSSKEYYDKYMKKENEGKCLICGKETTFRSFGVGYLEYCSTKCVNLNPKTQEKIKKTYKERTGYTHTMYNPNSIKIRENTCLEKYGEKHPMQANKVKEKIKKTCLEKYGVEHSFQSENNREKSKKTCLERYGVTNVSLNNIIKEKIRKSNVESHKDFFIKNLLPENYEIINYEETGNIELKCDKGHVFKCQKQLVLKRIKANHVVCTVCQPLNSFENSTSKYEKELLKFIEENYNGTILQNTKEILNNLELDIYLPELKLAFEFNGLYWHSELYREKNYHLNKTKRCLNKEIQLIHVYEDDWLYKNEIVKSRVLNLLGKTERKIYARKCTINEVDNKTIKTFLEENHIQGYVSSDKNIGLFIENELVSLMTFGKGRFHNKNTELLRFCNKLNTNVVGGASKIFKYYVSNYKNNIISYADRSWSNGNLYRQLGFNFVKETPVNFSYISNGIRLNRFKYRKSELIKQGYDKNRTEHDIMQEKGLYRIYDSGNLKYEYIINTDNTIGGL
jgi:hypothetical protein